MPQKKSVILPIILGILSSYWLIAQDVAHRFQVGFGAGLSTYEGDLAPVSFRGSLGKGHPSIALGIKYAFSESLAVRLMYAKGEISASDANAISNDLRMARNLSFRSPIDDLSLGAEIRLTNLFHIRYDFISPYMYAGVSVFHFDPMAIYQDKWVRLQPLSTEGQGIPELSNRSVYKLTQVSIPLEAGIQIRLNWLFSVEFGVTYHKTFTDYIDDVSTVFVNNNRLRAIKGDLSANLSDRSGELSGGSSVFTTDLRRGDPKDLDAFIFYQAKLYYTLATKQERQFYKKVRCPQS